jgi:TPR repeat protein
MGIGCRRDALEANVWYVKAADQGDERAKHRIATIRAAADGANPVMASRNGGRLRRPDPKSQGSSNGSPYHLNVNTDIDQENEKPKQKRFVIF